MPDIHWIKISTGMWEDEKVAVLSSRENGDAIIMVWVRLLCLAGKCNDCGSIYLSRDVPYTAETLSTVFHKPISLIRSALKAFQDLGMVEVSEGNGIIYVRNWAKYQNVDGMEKFKEQNRNKVARYRERLKIAGGDDYRQYTGMVFARDHNRCVYCGSEENLVIDHLTPLILGGSNHPDNLVCACKKCNCGKAGKRFEETGYKFMDETKYDQLKKVTPGNANTERHHTDLDLDLDSEKKERMSTSFCTEPEVPAPVPKHKDPVVSFDFEEKLWEGISDAEVERWKEAYPALRIETELAKAAEWLIANPTRRKKNNRRFLVNWFSKSQERGGDRGGRR